MQYVTSFEHIGREKGLQQGLEKGLQQGLQQGLEKGLQQGRKQGQIEQSQRAVIDVLIVRFQNVPISTINRLLSCEEVSLLQELLRQAITVPSPEDFEVLLRQMTTPNESRPLTTSA